jgi:hypothetical protein
MLAAQYLPGIIATLAIIMINCIRREELTEADPWDDAAGFCRCGGGGGVELVGTGRGGGTLSTHSSLMYVQAAQDGPGHASNRTQQESACNSKVTRHLGRPVGASGRELVTELCLGDGCSCSSPVLILRVLVASPAGHLHLRRPRFWLFVSYCVSFASIIGSVWVMIDHYGE